MTASRRLVLGATLPLLAGIALLALLVWLVGPATTVVMLGRLDAWQLVALVATAFLGTAFGALALRVILHRYGHRVSTWLLFRLSILAFAVGWLVPSGYVAGFPVAAYLLRRRGVPLGRGLAAFLIERFFELGAYALVLPAVCLGRVVAGPALVPGLLAPTAGVLIVVLDLVLGWRLGRRTLGALRTHAPRPVVPAFGHGIDFLGTVSTFFEGSPGLLVLALALSALAICTTFARGVLAAHFLQLPLGVGEIALLLAFSLVLVAIPFLPGALGIYEGGMVGVFQLLGRPAAEGIAYAMVVHGVELVVAAVGLVFLAHLGVGLATLRVMSVSHPTDRRVA